MLHCSYLDFWAYKVSSVSYNDKRSALNFGRCKIANSTKIEANSTKIEANGTKIEANSTKIEVNSTKIEANSTKIEMKL